MQENILIIGALGDGPDGMSQATIMLRDIWKKRGKNINVVDFFENGGAGVGVRVINKILSSYKNNKIAKKHIKSATTVYITPKLSPLGFISCIGYFKTCIKYNKPYTLHFHGRAFWRTYQKYSFLQKSMKKYITNAYMNVALTQSLKQEILDLGIGGNWTIVGNYAQDFMMLKDEEIQQKKEVYSKKPLKIAYLSNIIETKGIFELMEAVKNDNRFSLYIAGKVFPDEKERFNKLLNSSMNMKYLGFVSGDDKRWLLKTSALFVLATQYPTEAQPISVIEALCMGCIVISTKHIGILDTLGKDYPSELQVKRDTQDIKQKLNELYENNCVQGEYILNNITDYREKFSQDKYASAIYECLKLD